MFQRQSSADAPRGECGAVGREARPRGGQARRIVPPLVAAWLGGMLLHGCGGVKDAPPSIPIKGTVTFKGQPVTSGEVVYTPAKAGAGGRMARGGIASDGTFQLRTSPSVPGVVPGEYAISLVVLDQTQSGVSAKGPSSDPLERPSDDRNPVRATDAIPAKYLSPETSGLTETVDENHAGVTDIVLD